MISVNNVVQSFRPSREGLFNEIHPYLSDTIISEIAQADGGHGERENKQALLDIMLTRKVAGKLDWYPAEVCNLLRWDTSIDNQDENIMGVFISWILINAYVQPESDDTGMVEEGDPHALARLLETSLALGPSFQTQALRFMAWAYQTISELEEHRLIERPFYLLSMLLLCLYNYCDYSTEQIQALYKLLEEQENISRKLVESDWIFFPDETHPKRWVLGLESDINDMHNRFLRVCKCIKAKHKFEQNQAALDMIQLLSTRMATDPSNEN